MSKLELKPCPYCGCDNPCLRDRRHCWVIFCPVCEVEMDHDTEQQVIDHWNSRKDKRIEQLDAENVSELSEVTHRAMKAEYDCKQLRAKLDAVRNVKTFGMEASGSSDGTYRVVLWAKWNDVLEALGDAK